VILCVQDYRISRYDGGHSLKGPSL
jgi:hypothetical protein